MISDAVAKVERESEEEDADAEEVDVEAGVSIFDLLHEVEWVLAASFLSHFEVCHSLLAVSKEMHALLTDASKFPQFKRWTECKHKIEALLTAIQKKDEWKLTRATVNHCGFRRSYLRWHSPLALLSSYCVYGAIRNPAEERVVDDLRHVEWSTDALEPWLSIDCLRYLCQWSGLRVAVARGSEFRGKAIIKESTLCVLSNYFEALKKFANAEDYSLKFVTFELDIRKVDATLKKATGTKTEVLSKALTKRDDQIRLVKRRRKRERVEMSVSEAKWRIAVYTRVVEYLQSRGAVDASFRAHWAGSGWTQRGGDDDWWDIGLCDDDSDCESRTKFIRFHSATDGSENSLSSEVEKNVDSEDEIVRDSHLEVDTTTDLSALITETSAAGIAPRIARPRYERNCCDEFYDRIQAPLLSADVVVVDDTTTDLSSSYTEE